MTKLVTAFVCLLGLTAAFALPAHAGDPTQTKTITLDCTSATGDTVMGQATVTLCGASQIPSTGQTVTCPFVGTEFCNSASLPSGVITCTAPFKVTALSYNLTLGDFRRNAE